MKTIFVLLLLMTNALAASQTLNLDETLKQYVAEHNFNGTVLIEKGNERIHRGTYGLANKEFNIPTTAESKYKIASVTKLFTAVIIYQLVEEGRIKLEDKIIDHLPTYKGEGGDKVSIQNLLTSTSGIQDLEADGDIVYEKRLTSDEILTQYASGPLDFQPGTKFRYNNADYIILGKLIEKMYATTFNEVLHQKIIQPLRMKNSGIFDHSVVNNLAQSYWQNEKTKKVERDIPYYVENYYSAGAMYASASDLASFSNALFGHKILKKETLLELLKTVEEIENNDGYASGLWSFQFETDKGVNNIASRPGNIWGTEAMLQRFIEKEISIVILSNSMGTANMWQMLRLIQPYLE